MRSGDETSGVSGRTQPGKHPTLRGWLVLVCALCASMGLLAADGATHSQDKDCEDFATQRAAQDHRDTHASDPDRLDDANGVTCPDLPCPCGATELPPPVPTPVRAAPTGPVPEPLTTSARVTAVVDAGTLKVRLRAGNAVHVRLIGIDRPTPRGVRSAAGCGAAEASARMRRLAFRNGVGRRVRLTSDPTQAREDHSDRRFAYVDARGVDFGRTLISSGWAKVDVAGSDFLRLGSYRQAQQAARVAARGAWRMCRSRAAR
jgi:endonuclease YncB( thermonuclease family)